MTHTHTHTYCTCMPSATCTCTCIGTPMGRRKVSIFFNMVLLNTCTVVNKVYMYVYRTAHRWVPGKSCLMVFSNIPFQLLNGSRECFHPFHMFTEKGDTDLIAQVHKKTNQTVYIYCTYFELLYDTPTQGTFQTGLLKGLSS